MTWPRVEWDSYQNRQVDSTSSRIHHVLVKTSFSCSSVWKEKGKTSYFTQRNPNKYITCRNFRTLYRTFKFRKKISHNWWKRLSNFTLTKHELHWNNIYENAILTASSAVLQIQLRENNILYQVLLRISKGLSTELCFLNETKIFGATSKFYTVLYIFWTLENFGRYVFGHYLQKFGDSGVTNLITQSQAKRIRK